MGRRLNARVEISDNCPMFRTSDVMAVDLPEVIKEESSAICMIALADLLPDMLRTAVSGLEPAELLSCRGCRAGKASARFRVSVGEVAVDSELRASLLPLLRNIPMFQALTERQLEHVLPSVETSRHDDGDVLLEHNQPGRALFIISTGEVEVLAPNENGKLGQVAVLGEGECLGEMSLLTGEPCSATIRCKGAVESFFMTKEDFHGLLERVPQLNSYFSRLLALRLKKTSSKLLEDLKGDHDISGDLAMLSVAEIVQAIAATNRTGMLTLTNEENGQSLNAMFRTGQVFRIDHDFEAEPEEGFYEAMGWKVGAFRFKVANPENVERNVFRDTMGLLLEAMRRQDEGPDPLSALDG